MLFSPRHVESACCQRDWWPSVVLLIIWLGQCLLGIWEVFPFPLFSYCRFWKEVTVHRSGRPCPTQLRAEYLYQFFVIPLHDRFVYSLPFIYLLDHLSILIWTHRFVLYFMLLFNTAFFFSQIVPALSIGYPFSSTHVPFHYYGFYPFLSSFLPFFLSFLLSDITRCSRLVFSLPRPRISNFSKEAWFLSLNNGVRNKIVIVGTRTSDNMRRYTCVYWPVCIHMSVHLSCLSINVYPGCLCLSICLSILSIVSVCI